MGDELVPTEGLLGTISKGASKTDSGTQKNNEAEDYYEVVRRPLNMPLGKTLYQMTVHPSTIGEYIISQIFPDAAHWHLLSPSGKNKGFAMDGYFSEQRNRSDYEYVPMYRGQKIPVSKVDEFFRQRQAEWDKAADILERYTDININEFDELRDHYNPWYNCKDFIKKVEPPLHPEDDKPSLFDIFQLYAN